MSHSGIIIQVLILLNEMNQSGGIIEMERVKVLLIKLLWLLIKICFNE